MKKTLLLLAGILVFSVGHAQWTTTGTNIYNSNTGYVGVGTSTPYTKLHVKGGEIRAENGTDLVRIGSNDASGYSYIMFGDDATDRLDFRYTYYGNNVLQTGDAIMSIFPNGNVGIGTVNPDSKLTVNGLIKSEEIIVQDVGADFVFENGYKLLPLKEVEKYITENNHLPGVAPASETVKGIKVGEFNTMLLQKIEELTLYMIELKKQNDNLQKEVDTLKSK